MVVRVKGRIEGVWRSVGAWEKTDQIQRNPRFAWLHRLEISPCASKYGGWRIKMPFFLVETDLGEMVASADGPSENRRTNMVRISVSADKYTLAAA